MLYRVRLQSYKLGLCTTLHQAAFQAFLSLHRNSPSPTQRRQSRLSQSQYTGYQTLLHFSNNTRAPSNASAYPVGIHPIPITKNQREVK